MVLHPFVGEYQHISEHEYAYVRVLHQLVQEPFQRKLALVFYPKVVQVLPSVTYEAPELPDKYGEYGQEYEKEKQKPLSLVSDVPGVIVGHLETHIHYQFRDQLAEEDDHALQKEIEIGQGLVASRIKVERLEHDHKEKEGGRDESEFQDRACLQ